MKTLAAIVLAVASVSLSGCAVLDVKTRSGVQIHSVRVLQKVELPTGTVTRDGDFVITGYTAGTDGQAAGEVIGTIIKTAK